MLLAMIALSPAAGQTSSPPAHSPYAPDLRPAAKVSRPRSRAGRGLIWEWPVGTARLIAARRFFVRADWLGHASSRGKITIGSLGEASKRDLERGAKWLQVLVCIPQCLFQFVCTR